VRYYELSDEAPYAHYLNEYKSSVPQRGMCFMAKRNLNVGECEIARAYKLTPKGFVEVLSFNVPRKVRLAGACLGLKLLTSMSCPPLLA